MQKVLFEFVKNTEKKRLKYEIGSLLKGQKVGGRK